jgi:hypothetical protein
VGDRCPRERGYTSITAGARPNARRFRNTSGRVEKSSIRRDRQKAEPFLI